MIKHKEIRIVEEDLIVGDMTEVAVAERSFGYGYEEFQFPLTVSFCSHGKYEVEIRIVEEDLIVGDMTEVAVAERSFGYGYEEFQFPLTVSFCSHGKYEVEIKGKRATVKRIE